MMLALGVVLPHQVSSWPSSSCILSRASGRSRQAVVKCEGRRPDSAQTAGQADSFNSYSRSCGKYVATATSSSWILSRASGGSRQAVVKCEGRRPDLSQNARQADSFNSYSRSCSKYVATAASRALGATAAVTESGKFSMGDSALQDRGFEIHSSSELLNLDQLNTLFVRVGFPRRQPEKLARALEHTLSLIWLRDVKSEKLIAFARATGDDVFNAIIWDVVVDPSYQGSGLGKVLIERLLADLVRKGISSIALYAEPNVVGFYKPLGFIADPDGIRAMAYSKRRR